MRSERNSAALRIVLFDAVGTLITPCPSVVEAYLAAGRRFGSSLTAESIRLRFRSAFARQEALDAAAAAPHNTSEDRERHRWRTIVGEVFNDVADSEGLFQSLWDHFAQPQHWRVYDDVGPCFERLTQRGLLVGIASNFDARLDVLCAGHSVLAACPRRFISSQIGHKKPSFDFFRAIERSLDLPPQAILLVGDDLENDYEAARRAEWQALFLARDGQPSSSLNATSVIGRLSEVWQRVAG